ncbi:MAG TPA: hypothetical protein PKK59_05045 [Anaerolineaceae bacterium]|nr:hypothetical protein [Anaerolineaceae bacterium]
MDQCIEKNLEYLTLFIKKSRELNKLSYFDKGRKMITENYYRDENGNLQIEANYPSDEQKKALLLTLRMFWQKKDRVYYRKFLDFYREIPFSTKWKSEVWNIIFILDIQLDSWYVESPIDKRLTHKEFFEIFLYGDEAHLDKDKRERYIEFTKDNILKTLNESTFHKVILDISSAIISLGNISNRELLKLNISID